MSRLLLPQGCSNKPYILPEKLGLKISKRINSLLSFLHLYQKSEESNNIKI